MLGRRPPSFYYVRRWTLYVTWVIELYSLSSTEHIVLVLVCWLSWLLLHLFNPGSSHREGGRLTSRQAEMYDLQLHHLCYTLYSAQFTVQFTLFTYYTHRLHFHHLPSPPSPLWGPSFIMLSYGDGILYGMPVKTWRIIKLLNWRVIEPCHYDN